MIEDTLILLAELAALFLGVSFLITLMQRRLGDERLRHWMGGTPLVSALKGIGVGFVTPFCTYSAIPVLIGLRRAGVPPAGYVAFIVAAPVLDPILFGALVLIVGLQAALVYLVVTFCTAVIIALVAQRMGIERSLRPLAALAHETTAPVTEPVGEVVASASCTDHFCAMPDDRTWRGLPTEATEAGRSALHVLRTMAPILLLGVGIGLGIEVLVPPGLVASITGGGNHLAIPMAAGLGTPLYFNTGLFVPIADSLSAVGVGVGAIVALTIAGAGANIPEFVILGRLARTRVVLIFVGYVIAVAVIGGYLAQALSG